MQHYINKVWTLEDCKHEFMALFIFCFLLIAITAQNSCLVLICQIENACQENNTWNAVPPHQWSREWEGSLSTPKGDPWCSSYPRCRPVSRGLEGAGRWSKRHYGWWTWQKVCGWPGPLENGVPEGNRGTAEATSAPRSKQTGSSSMCACGGSSPSRQTTPCSGTADSWTGQQTVQIQIRENALEKRNVPGAFL